MKLSVDKLNLNYITFCKKLEKYNCFSKEMMDDLGERIKNCSYTMNNDTGSCYQGSLIDIVLNHLCATAYSINENVFSIGGKLQDLKVNNDMLMRVLLLQHISKCEMFVPTVEQWKIKKGIYYDFNSELKSSLKLGERSLYICQKYGIQFTEEEYEAIRVIDKTDEERINNFMSPLCMIVKIANQVVSIEMRQKYLKENKKEIMEE